MTPLEEITSLLPTMAADQRLQALKGTKDEKWAVDMTVSLWMPRLRSLLEDALREQVHG